MANQEVDKFLADKEQDAEDYLAKIDDMLSQPQRFGFAEQTLIDIYNYIEENGEITPGQKQTIENIYNGSKRT